jgi:hypothetical protein
MNDQALWPGRRSVETRARIADRVMQGPEAIAAAQQLRDERAAKSQWPFPWAFPPPGAIRVTAGADSSGTLLMPTALAGETEALLFTVDQGYQFALEALVVEYLNAGSQGLVSPGAFTWSLTLNRPVGIPTFQGQGVQGLSGVDVGLGTLQIPWPLAKAELFEPNDAIRVTVTNVSIPDGDPNYVKAILLGWKWPVT